MAAKTLTLVPNHACLCLRMSIFSLFLPLASLGLSLSLNNSLNLVKFIYDFKTFECQMF